MACIENPTRIVRIVAMSGGMAKEVFQEVQGWDHQISRGKLSGTFTLQINKTTLQSFRNLEQDDQIISVGLGVDRWHVWPQPRTCNVKKNSTKHTTTITTTMQLYETLKYSLSFLCCREPKVSAFRNFLQRSHAKSYQLHTWQTDWQQKAKMESESILNMPWPETELGRAGVLNRENRRVSSHGGTQRCSHCL